MTERNAKEMQELARKAKLPLFLYVRSYQIPEIDAWDIVQETFVYICERNEPLPATFELRKALVLKVAKFRIFNHFRVHEQQSELPALLRDHFISTGMTYARDSSEILEARQQLELVLPALSEQQLEVFTTKVLDELKVTEVATKLDMNPNTARGYLSRALETLREKLENLEPRDARGLILLLAISSILALAESASAMIGRLKRLWGATDHTTLRGVVSVATAAAIVLVPPNFATSRDNLANWDSRGVSPIATNIAPEPKTPSTTITPKKTTVGSTITSISPISASQPRLRWNAPKKTTVNAGPPDHLLGMAMRALHTDHPEEALELLDQYPVQDLKWANALRAQAKAAIAAKKQTVQ